MKNKCKAQVRLTNGKIHADPYFAKRGFVVFPQLMKYETLLSTHRYDYAYYLTLDIPNKEILFHSQVIKAFKSC